MDGALGYANAFRNAALLFICPLAIAFKSPEAVAEACSDALGNPCDERTSRYRRWHPLEPASLCLMMLPETSV